MTLGEKIQTCRKSKGISQEEMASVLGVSRQALSKWECNTSTPDVDKIIAISKYFGVSTDFLLIEGHTDENSVTPKKVEKQNGNNPIALSTAIIAIGLLIAFAMANDGTKFFYWQLSSAALGIGIQIAGIGIFEILYFNHQLGTKSQYMFWSINTWLVSGMPIILISNVFSRLLNSFDVLFYSFTIMLIYLIVNSILTITFIILSKRSYRTK